MDADGSQDSTGGEYMSTATINDGVAGKPPWPAEVSLAETVVIFDGVCKFCDRSVQWILKHERGPQLRFAAAQSATGAALLHYFGLAAPSLDSVVVIERGQAYQKSTAVLRLIPYLRRSWQWLRVGWLLPHFLRDWCYDRFAGRRYAWFGKHESCMLPTPSVAKRFLP